MEIDMKVIFQIFELKGSIDSIYSLSGSDIEINDSIEDLKEKVNSIVNDIKAGGNDGTNK